jgi:hypothetical protein
MENSRNIAFDPRNLIFVNAKPLIDPKRQDRRVAAKVNVRLFTKGLSMMLKALINGSIVGDRGSSMGTV